MDAQRSLLLVLTLATVAATPVSAQMLRATSQSEPIPDFSGIWGHPYLFPGFEPPLSGPGPLVNKYRRRQVSDVDGHPMPPTQNVFPGDNNKLVADYTNPILKPQAAEAVRKHGEIESSGAAAPNPSNQCWPEPLPYIFWNFGIQMLQHGDKITILYDEDHEFRQVRMNAEHPARVTASWYGDSVGRYEGDTLVIDTVGIMVDRPFAMADMFGTPYTSALHVVERYRLIGHEAAMEALERANRELWRLPGPAEGWTADPNDKGKALQLHFSVEDEGVFTMPWSATITYRRVTREWPETVCAENVREYYASAHTAVPRADKPEF
jgi:hypothetical protein